MVQSTTPTTPVSDHYYIIKSCAKKTSAKGDVYLDMMFMNASEEISAKLWDYKPGVHDWIAAGMIVKVRGNEELWNDKKQFRIQRIRRIGPEDRMNLRELVPCAPYDGDDLFAKLQEVTASITDESMRTLVSLMINRQQEKLIICPAAVRLHHAMAGGLLYHTMSIVRLAEGVCQVYPFVRRDLLLSGIILHDLAKIDELMVEETGLASGYTVRGELLGHLVMGAMAVEKAADELQTPDETRMLLEHMLISHHGLPEYGAAVRPMVLEAELLSALDNLDATVNQITSAMSTVEPGGFTSKLWAMDQRKFYRATDRGEPQDGEFIAKI